MKKLLTIGLMCVALQAQAINLRFLQNSILTDFSKDEIMDFRQFLRKSLDTIEDKKVVEWKASSSSLSGKYKAISSYYVNGILCKRSRFLVANEDKREVYQFEICKDDNDWKIQDTPVKSLTKDDIEKIRMTAKIALNHEGEAIPFSWYNPDNGNAGVLVPLLFTDANCRNLAITVLNKQGEAANATYLFCRSEKGEWERSIEAGFE